MSTATCAFILEDRMKEEQRGVEKRKKDTFKIFFYRNENCKRNHE